MNVAIVASRNFPVAGWPYIEDRITRLPVGAFVLVRPSVGTVDEIISIYAQRHGYQVRYLPVTKTGRGATFRRDIELVDSADQIIAFFAPDRIMDGGTGHIVEKAQDARKPVEAWSINEDDMLFLVGSGGKEHVTA